MRVQSRAGLSIGCTISCDWRFLRRAAVALLIGLSSGSASAAVWVVDTPDDSIDIAPGDAACSDASGRCSLRGAIMESNALAGADDVWLPVGAETGDDIYYLDLSQPDSDSAAIGDLDIHDDLILRRRPLDGPRIAQIARLSDISTTPNRIIDIHPPARVQIADVAIAWALSNPDISCVLAGCRTLTQLEENTRAVHRRLEPGVLRRLNAATDEVRRLLGPNPDYYQGLADTRSW